MRPIIAALLLAAAPAFAAPCITRDAWTGPDKTKHFVGGAAIASAVTLATRNPHYGFGAGVAVAIAKEAYDRTGRGTCSLQDMAVTVAGAAAGAYGTAWVILPQRRGVSVAVARAF
jgi:putative lipoprotein